MYKDLTKEELTGRMKKFRALMDQERPDWETAIILSKVSQYYFTGTMQDGMLVFKREGQTYYFVRKSLERARDESPLDEIYPMVSYRDAAKVMGITCGNTYMETEIVTMAILERLKKYFTIDNVRSLDQVLFMTREIKTPYEIAWITQSGNAHRDFLENIVPTLLEEGMSEADFVGLLFYEMVKHGYQGVSRFSRFQTEMVVGQVGFGVNSLYPTSFDGPGGALGMYPAVPLLGSRERKLKKGDLVFVDIAFGMNGYHSDKTQVYMFGAKPSDEVIKAHWACIDIQKNAASMLKPGAIPSEIYLKSVAPLDNAYKQDFMGFNGRQVKFLGHGVGLHIDEMPVIAGGFDVPLKENMVIALEPKIGLANVGMVGVEDTYLVTPQGGHCITGGGRDIIEI